MADELSEATRLAMSKDMGVKANDLIERALDEGYSVEVRRDGADRIVSLSVGGRSYYTARRPADEKGPSYYHALWAAVRSL